uniref:isoleucine--tRNA ligase n=1 Tax=Graphocephala atropunctata TaxID=36148 RepID=A0A1B6KXD7_9HEMI
MESTNTIHMQLSYILIIITGKTLVFFTTNISAINPIYSKVDPNADLSRLEKVTLTFWEENRIFQQSIERRPENNRFVFYDGPPFANGRPHYGHLLTGYVKDTYARYQTMQGRRVERRAGWDCHGLPAEMATEKELNISGKIDIERFGVAKFNKHCRDTVVKYVSAWESYVSRQGRWVNLEGGYKTMSLKYMESVMWGFKQLYQKGLVYEAERVVPYSWACQSPLSNFETRLDNSYRIKSSKAVTVSFELLEKPTRLENLQPPCKMLVWTTTPWTLVSNLALAVGRDVTYSVAWIQPSYGGKTPHLLYIFAKNYTEKFESICDKKNLHYQNLGMELTYKDLAGLRYEPLFPFFNGTKNAFKVLCADYVTAEEGTGVVHIAPGFGEDDFELCKRHDIPTVCPIDSAGRFTGAVGYLNGTHVFNAESDIVNILKSRKNWFYSEQYSHRYPHCWRTDTPLIYRTMMSWYVAVTGLRGRMAELNKRVNWVPSHVKEGIFGNWIDGAQDWSISRNRFWGTPIPVWKSDNPQYPRIDVYGSLDEIEKDFGKRLTELHRPFIDSLTRPNPDDPSGKSMMRRVPDVFDCWFDSGSMPFAQYHYPFENKHTFEDNFPADFVSEYIAQTRGWFYTSFILSTALFDKEPFKNCVSHGVVLDPRGNKLSKRHDNYVDPAVLMTKYGSDALRYLMLSRPVVAGDNLLFDKHGKCVEEVLRVVLKPIWNSYNFFTLYANSDGIKANISSNPILYKSTIDKYILLKCFQTIDLIKIHLDQFDSQEACRVINDFFDVLNNWYIRCNRERFWKKEHDRDKFDTYNVVYTVFNYILRASASLLPFLTDTIWRGLAFKEVSVHLTDFPNVEKMDQGHIITKMDFARGICNAAMSLRKLHKVRVRQPLKSMTIYHSKSTSLLDEEFIKIIKDETNVKEVNMIDGFKEIADLHLQLNFPIIGKRIPSSVKRIIDLVNKNQWKKHGDDNIVIGDEKEHYIILRKEYEMKLKPKSKKVCLFDDGRGVLKLDLNLDDDLILEGYARDVVRKIQDTRKQAELHISDKIRVTIQTKEDKIKEAIIKWMDYIKKQTLSFSLTVEDNITEDLFSRQYDNLLVALRIHHDIE